MNESVAIIFTQTLEKLRAARSISRARRIAQHGLARLRAIDQINGVMLHRLVRENRDARIGALRAVETPRPSHAPGDFSALEKSGLTRRECEVLGWVAHGKRDAEIAAILGISKKTVGKHLEHLFSKLHVETRTAAVGTAQERVRRMAGAKSKGRAPAAP